MAVNDSFQHADICRDLAQHHLWRASEEVAEAAIQLLRIYREIDPLAKRLLTLPPTWTAAYEEVFLLFRHLAESLGGLRSQARVILQALGENPGDPDLPDYAPKKLLAQVITRLDNLEAVTPLSESERSLLPLHVAEIAAEATEAVRLEAWLVNQENRQAHTPAFLWKLASSVEHHLARSHIFDRCDSERGVLTLIDRLLAASRGEGQTRTEGG